MATTKRTRSTSDRSRKSNDSLATRTGRTIKERPYVSAAIATGAVTAVVAAAAGAFFFSRRDQSLADTTDELTGRIRDGLSDAGEKLASLKRRATGTKTQQELSEEALTLKDSTPTAEHPMDETVEQQTKAGALAY
jgi:hypothetical protein